MKKRFFVGPGGGSHRQKLSGRFVPLNKWEVPAQITALALVHNPLTGPGISEILLSQPDNRYVRLDVRGAVRNDGVGYHVAENGDSGSTAFVPVFTEKMTTFYTLFDSFALIPSDSDLSEQFVSSEKMNFSKILVEKISSEQSLVVLANWDGEGLLYLFEPSEGCVLA